MLGTLELREAIAWEFALWYEGRPSLAIVTVELWKPFLQTMLTLANPGDEVIPEPAYLEETLCQLNRGVVKAA